jgi:leucyl-tRNA synthetase
VFLGKSKEKVKVDAKVLEGLQKEFGYWYPMDYRGSGKDLIQNHLAFSIFIHTAVFPKKNWPRAFGVNGWVTVDGNKMSKSLGNVIPVRIMIKEFGADASRFTVLSGGEGLDDANWDSEMAKSMRSKLGQLLKFYKEHYGKGTDKKRSIDSWMESKLQEIIRGATQAMEQTMFRSALQWSYFELQRALRWYLRRAGTLNKELMQMVIESQLLMLAPFTPHTCEEGWEIIGKEPFISVAEWPKYDDSKIDKDSFRAEEIIKQSLDDTLAVLKLSKITKPKEITFFVAMPWKYGLYALLKEQESRDFRQLMQVVMSKDEFKRYAKDITKIIPKVLKSGIGHLLSYELELKSLQESKGFFERELRCGVKIEPAEISKESKARQALPGKPAILVK